MISFQSYWVGRNKTSKAIFRFFPCVWEFNVSRSFCTKIFTLDSWFWILFGFEIFLEIFVRESSISIFQTSKMNSEHLKDQSCLRKSQTLPLRKTGRLPFQVCLASITSSILLITNIPSNSLILVPGSFESMLWAACTGKSSAFFPKTAQIFWKSWNFCCKSWGCKTKSIIVKYKLNIHQKSVKSALI